MINIQRNRPLFSPAMLMIAGNLRQYIWIVNLIVWVFLSGLALVYVNDMHRQMMIKKEILMTQAVKIHNQWEQLLKQQNQLSNEGKIANEAKRKLAMELPVKPHIVTVAL